MTGSNLRFALRTFRKNPGFTATAIATLALCLGANAAIFTFVDGVLLKPVDYFEPERMVMVWEKPPGGERNGVATANFLDWRDRNKVFSAISMQTGRAFAMTGEGEPERLSAMSVSASYFDVLGVSPVIGRGFLPGEDEVGKDHVAVLTHKSWKSRFGGDPRILERKLILDGEPYSIVGVLPEGGRFDRISQELVVPQSFRPDQRARNFHWFIVLARLKPGVTIEQARTDMGAIAASIAEAYPDIKKDWGVTIDPFLERLVNTNLRQSLLVLMGAAAAVLLIGCANLANLLLARGSSRGRELAIRASLGARRGQLIGQLLTESVLLAGLGAIGGAVLGWALFKGIQFLTPPFMLPSEANPQIDWRVFLFLTAGALASGVLFGLLPAFQLSAKDPADAMRESGRSSTGGVQRGRIRTALVISEVAIAFILLVGAGLMIRSFQKLLGVDPGFRTENIITMGMPLAMEKNTEGSRLSAYVAEVVENTAALPGIRQAAITSALPMQGWGFGMPFRIASHAPVDASKRPACFFKIVTPSYFPAIGMKLNQGRLLASTDVSSAPRVTVVNETFVKRFLPNEDPLGKRVMIEEIVTGRTQLGPEIPWEIVGIVADEKVNSLDSEPSPGVYVPFPQSPVVGFNLLVSADNDPRKLTKAIQQRVWSVNSAQPLTNIRTLEEIRSETTAGNRLRTALLGTFAALALILACIGIYGVLSYATAQRTQELGVRAALGASRRDLLGLVLRSGMTMTIIGLAIGAAGAAALTRVVAGLLFQMQPNDPPTFAAVAAILFGVALLACYIPARRAAKVDPVVALRYE